MRRLQMILRLVCVCSLLSAVALAQLDVSTCGQAKGCLFAPTGCVPNQNCQISFSYMVMNGQQIRLELAGSMDSPSNGYVAVGFSRDTNMGEDSVSACVSNNGQTNALLGYTQGKSLNVLQSNVQQTITASAVNGNLYCVVERPLINTGSDEIFELNQTYVVLLAKGPLTNSVPSYHGSNRWVLPRSDIGRYGTDATGQQIFRDSENNTSAGSGHSTADKLKIVHGILMVLAWSVFLFTGILFARHFRAHWPDTTFLGVKMWFNLHRGLNMFGVGLTIAAFVLIFVANDWRWTGPKAFQSGELNRQWSSIHSILGLLACVIAWAQPLNAVFRCEHDSKTRPIFNMIHRFFGFSAWLLAAAATMIAVKHFKGMFSNSDAALGLYIAYIAVAGLTLIILEVTWIRNFFASRRGTADEVEMVRVGEVTAFTLRSDEQKTQRAQLAVLLLYVVCAVGLSIAICVLIGKKPGDLA